MATGAACSGAREVQKKKKRPQRKRTSAQAQPNVHRMKDANFRSIPVSEYESDGDGSMQQEQEGQNRLWNHRLSAGNLCFEGCAEHSSYSSRLKTKAS